MELFDLSLSAANNSAPVGVRGDGFWYKTGSVPAGQDSRIVVTPQGGNGIRLKPGQRIRFDHVIDAWQITSYDGTSTITGEIIIGSGDFGDDNVSNTFTLDASFANNVTVMNDAAHRVPVSLDTTQTLSTGSILAYTTSYSSNAASTAGNPIQMLAAATNVNGVLLNKFELIGAAAGGGNGIFAILAKATAPAGITDGDVLFSAYMTSASAKFSMDVAKDGMPKVAAGKAIWYISSAGDSIYLRDALFTVL